MSNLMGGRSAGLMNSPLAMMMMMKGKKNMKGKKKGGNNKGLSNFFANMGKNLFTGSLNETPKSQNVKIHVEEPTIDDFMRQLTEALEKDEKKVKKRPSKQFNPFSAFSKLGGGMNMFGSPMSMMMRSMMGGRPASPMMGGNMFNNPMMSAFGRI